MRMPERSCDKSAGAILPIGAPRWRSKDPSGHRQEAACITAQSAMVRVSGPAAMTFAKSVARFLIRDGSAVVPLRLTRPQQAAGMRGRSSVARRCTKPIGPIPAATAAAAPPLDPTQRAFGIPRVACDAENRSVGLAADAKLQGRRLPDHDGTCGPQPCDQHVIPVRRMIGQSD